MKHFLSCALFCVVTVFATLLAGTERELPTVASEASTTVPRRFEFQSMLMGTQVRLILYADCSETAEKAAEDAFRCIEHLNNVMSDYDSDSELSRLTARPAGEPIPLSDDLFRVLDASKHFSTISGGAFDVTVGPLTRLWRRSRRKRELPKPEQLSDARSRVGNELWELDAAGKSLRLKKEGIRFDLGAIGKGYAIDRAFETIRGHGLSILLVDAGGDIRVGAAPPDRDGWRINLGGDTVVPLENIALATSGDSERFVVIDGLRYSHLIDPKTGLGLTVSSTVQVAAPTAMEADALASVLSVLGPEKGLPLLRMQKNPSAKIRLHEGDRVFRSENWIEP